MLKKYKKKHFVEVIYYFCSVRAQIRVILNDQLMYVLLVVCLALLLLFLLKCHQKTI